MAWNTAAQLTSLHSLVAGLAGVQSVKDGVPESLANQVCAYITLGGQRVFDKAGGLASADCNYRVTFGYRVAGAEASAEATLAAVIDAFKTAFLAARTS
jgi:hypothetical protein